MRWIDIILPEPEINQALDNFLTEAAGLATEIEGIQLMDGLDNVKVTRQMAKAGQALFKGSAFFEYKSIGLAHQLGLFFVHAYPFYSDAVEAQEPWWISTYHSCS